MYTCASCTVYACFNNTPEQMPKNCPIRKETLMEESVSEYAKPENREFYVKSSEIEQMGYCRWPRLREIIEFAKQMGYEKLGLAFCYGLRGEAKTVADVLRRHGFEVVSVICKTGGIDKGRVGIDEARKLSPGGFEAMCNPVAQAVLLNEQRTQLNIVLGLCVGHDSMFYRYTDAFATTLVTKDRVLAHNPAGAIYCAYGYAQKALDLEDR